MKRFSFPLERVMHFREAQVASEKQKLMLLHQQLARITEAVTQLRASRTIAEEAVAGSERVRGLDLNALSAYRTAVGQREQSLLRNLADLESRITEQRTQVVKIMRQHRLLEKLRGRRLSEWVCEANRETEQLTAECFLSGWNRNRLRNRAKIFEQISDI
jgi:flagellar export protein FliJ